MGAYDGAELSELIGLFLLHKIEKLINQKQVGLYRDDGLAAINASGPQLDSLRKKVIKLFKDHELNITVETNIRKTDFLDIFLDLESDIYKPYRKPNETPLYINVNSNHPKSIIKQLPNMVSNRISNLSSSAQIFIEENQIYQASLQAAGYKEKLHFQPKVSQKVPKNRKRKILWFNPPFSQNVQTNIGAKFLGLIDKHFKNTQYEKYFNRKNVKVSYSCLPNVENIIAAHNKRLLNTEKNTETASCNCRGAKTCPLNKNCCQNSVIYKATLETKNDTATYIGQAGQSFKERYNNHTKSFKNILYENETTLSKEVWKLKNENIDYKLSWSVICRASTYKSSSKVCQLCLLEKTYILTSKENLLNKRNEIMNKCRHRRKFLLSQVT